jgi:O-acetyl-ADP-ribose deacetylase (regulator of RNase III)
MKIQYVTGDATDPYGFGIKVIAHVCNDAGGWGRGFVVALSNRWPEPEKRYRDYHRVTVNRGISMKLGFTDLVPVDLGLYVVNMIAQRGIRRHGDQCAVDYAALRECLDTLGQGAVNLGATVHMPRIGTGLGGGDWAVIEPMIQELVVDRGVSVTVYDLPITP